MKTQENISYGFFNRLEITLKHYKKHIADKLLDNKLDITPDQWQVLDIIVNYKDIKYSEIASISRKDIASVNRIIDLLNQKGYVSRQTDPNNRRRVILGISNTGDSIHKSAGNIINGESARILKDFKEKRLVKQMKMLKNIAKKCR